METFLSLVSAKASEMGYVEGRNVTMEYRCAKNYFNRLPDLAACEHVRNITACALVITS
jgi:hypothetical protein